MAMSLLEDVKTVSELKKKTNEIFEQLHRTGRPVVVTVNGKPDTVLLDVAVFKNKLKAFNLGRLLETAEEQAGRGQIRPARKFLKEFKARAKVSR
jgi:prevent-host-death family protein